MAVTGIDLKTSGASACRIQGSEIGLLPELGQQNCSYCSSYPERCCRFSALKGCRAGNHTNRFGDIRRVRLSHSEV
eukprot:1567211-Pyramimonas_sp.AAC.1